MKGRRLHLLILLLLLAAMFSLATMLQPRAVGWSRRGDTDSLLKVLLGDGRRLFANHFFVKADVAFHSGYYPSVFDQAQAARGGGRLMAEETGQPDHDAAQEAAEEAREKQTDFLGPPKDWVERFGRNFMVTKHTHLEGEKAREILPWLRISAELDPQRVETYTVAAYWLRKRLGKPKEAEKFLREGLLANPNSYEILFQLGRLYWEDYHDAARARNVWELALRRWQEQAAGQAKPDLLAYAQITVNLARLEEAAGNLERAISYLELAKKTSPAPGALQQQIDELKLSVQKPASDHAR